MSTVTISMRLPRDEVERLDQLANEVGAERSAFFRRALRAGARDLMLERACEAYRGGEVTLSRAAEIAGLSLRDMILQMGKKGLEFSYGVAELQKDLQP